MKEAGHSRTELVLSLPFDELGVLLARLSPTPADGCSVRRPGEAVDERIDRALAPCDLLSPLDALCSLILAR